MLVLIDAPTFSTLLKYELRSARRFRRFATIVAMGTTNGIPPSLPKLLDETLRDSDVVAQDENELTVLMPETDPNGVLCALKRYILQTSTLGLRYGVATFPTDAREDHKLMSTALRRLNLAREQDGVVMVVDG